MAKKKCKQILPQVENLPPAIIYRVVNRSKTSSWGNSLLAIALILIGVSAISGGAWVSLQLFVNPDAVNDLNKILPKRVQLAATNLEQQPQTLKQIEEYLRKQGKISGEPLALETDAKTLVAKSLVLPVSKRKSNCQTDCQEIVELRVYQLVKNNFTFPLQADNTTYHLIRQLPVAGPDESFAISPIVDSQTANYGSTRLLPLTQLKRFSGTTPQSGIWLYLIGQSQQSANGIAYGHIIHYNPNRSDLSIVLTWTSPTGQVPRWQQVTGGGFPELIVDRTSDLEPYLQVYQVKPAQGSINQFQLEPISIEEPAVKTTAYRHALFLARNGLWSPAWQWLKSRSHGNLRLSAAAQAQIDFIGLYAKYTSKQAESAWVSPSQQVIAALNDGRWGKGLQVYQASPENTQEIATLLLNDSGRLWNRVEAALEINPNRPEVQTWGALIIGAQDGQANAIAWLKQHSHSPKAFKYTEKLLKRLDGNYATSLPDSSDRPSRIIGYLEPTGNINLTDWLTIAPNFGIESKQKWQQIRVIAYNDGQNWLRSPFKQLKLPKTNLTKFLWQQLGLNIDPHLDIVLRLQDGQSQTTTVTVQAVQLQNGVLRLLAPTQSESLKQTALALSTDALNWVQPTRMTLAEFIKQESVDATEFLPAIWRELQSSNSNKSLPKFEQLQQELADLTVGLVDLTGDNNQDIVLTISAQEIAALTKDKSYDEGDRTIAFSDTGALLYSEFSSRVGKLKVIADLKDAAPPVLLIENAKKYNIRRWSIANQRFE